MLLKSCNLKGLKSQRIIYGSWYTSIHKSVEALHIHSSWLLRDPGWYSSIAGGHIRGKESSKKSHPGNERLQSGSDTHSFCSQFTVQSLSTVNKLKGSQIGLFYSTRKKGRISYTWWAVLWPSDDLWSIMVHNNAVLC